MPATLVRNGSEKHDKVESRQEKSLLPDKPEHGTSVITAFQQIRELIVLGRLSPGTWVVEGDLAERLNISRTPVRAALHWLQRDGYVIEHRTANKCRIVVAPLTKEDSSELYHIIGHVEGLVGRKTALLPEGRARRHGAEAEGAEPADGRGGRRSRQPPHASSTSTATSTCTSSKLAPGARLKTLHQAIEPQAERYWRLYASSIVHDLHLTVAEHAEIIRALVAGDPDELEQALQANWNNGCERLGRVIDVFGERGSW